MNDTRYCPQNADRDANQGRASDESSVDYGQSQGHHGDPLADKVTSERESNSGFGQ